jgi:hypothetical protein
MGHRLTHIDREGFLEELRNTVGGHLDGAVIPDALNQTDFERESLLEFGEIRGKIHYRFAGELLLAILLKGVPRHEEMETFENLLAKSAKLVRAVSAIDDVFACYARD